VQGLHKGEVVSEDVVDIGVVGVAEVVDLVDDVDGGRGGGCDVYAIVFEAS
jgi:hypothetical protein